MRKIYVQLFLVFICSLGATSCGNSTDNKVNTGASTDVPSKAPSGETALSVAGARDFLNADTANKGKEVTVTAYSWGTQNRMGGVVALMLGDKKLEGFQQATFVCIFPKEQEAKVKAIAKDTKVTVTGKIFKGSGGTELKDCMLNE